MATILNTNLYPPIVPDTLPAFIRNSKCRIYFSLSEYNTVGDISNVQISIVDQRTNASALKYETYPSGIKISTLETDESVMGDYKYYVQIIPKKDLVNGSFGLNQFYKIQLRFTARGTEDPPKLEDGSFSGEKLATWLYNNMGSFSEWSKVCLIKGISQPNISINGFNTKGQPVTFSTPLINISGTLSFADKDETEYLKNYNIKIFETNNPTNVVVDDKENYNDFLAINEFNHTIKYDLLDGVSYTLQFSYVTNNLYKETHTYKFSIVQNGIDKIDAEIQAIPDSENGYIKIKIQSINSKKFIGNLTIRRASSKENFHKWEDVKNIIYNSETNLNFQWTDITVESGVWYKYCIQKRDSRGNRGVITQIEEPVMCLFQDMFLIGGGRQLKIKFNPTVSSFKYNVTQSQQVTLGGKYPYIKRNSNNYYRSFSIGGLISSFMDTSDWYDPHFYNGEFHQNENELKLFTSKDEIYGDNLSLYQNYNNDNNISEYQDYIYEKQFRQKVYDFLYKYDVKLFKSTTEGNILVKLMDITFEPDAVLGRRLYSFSATAIQVAQANLTNYDKYNIQSIGEYSTYITYNYDKLGQISKTFNKDTDIIDIIQQQYTNNNLGYINKLKYLNWLKLEIESQPYLIIQKNGTLIKAEKNSDIIPDDAVFGYIVSINGEERVIKARRVDFEIDRQQPFGYTKYEGFLELKDPDVKITNLKFKYPTTASINYVANIDETEDTSNQVSYIYYYNRVGQLYGTFSPEDSIITKLYKKYEVNFRKYYQRLVEVKDIRIEGPQGAVVYVKDSKDSGFNKHILNNQYLQLKDDAITIQGLYFGGIKLKRSKDPLESITSSGTITFEEQSGLYESLSQISNPINGGIYTIKSYAIINDPYLDENNILIINEDGVQKTTISRDNIYTLIENQVNDDQNLKFVYYYGCWYVLPKAEQINGKPIKGDLRQIRDGEYIEVENEKYNYTFEIKNPINNAVYNIRYFAVNGFSFDPVTNTLTAQSEGNIEPDNDVLKTVENKITESDTEWALLLTEIVKNNKYIYYHEKWYPFTDDQQVLCPIDAIVDYYCEIAKGVY